MKHGRAHAGEGNAGNSEGDGAGQGIGQEKPFEAGGTPAAGGRQNHEGGRERGYRSHLQQYVRDEQTDGSQHHKGGSTVAVVWRSAGKCP